MKKGFFRFLFSALIAVTCSVAVWANEQAAQPAPCENCPTAKKKVEAGCACEKCVKERAAQAKPCDANGCDLAKKKNAEGTPCASKDCEHCAKMKNTESQPCCDKGKKQ